MRGVVDVFRSFGEQKGLLLWMCTLWVFMNLASGLFAWLPMIAKAVELKEQILYDSSLIAQVVGIASFLTAVEALTLGSAKSEGWVLGGLNVAWVFFFDI